MSPKDRKNTIAALNNQVRDAFAKLANVERANEHFKQRELETRKALDIALNDVAKSRKHIVAMSRKLQRAKDLNASLSSSLVIATANVCR